MDTKKKRMLHQAVEYYGKYTENQAKVLCALVDNSVDDQVFIHVTKLYKQIGVTRSPIYATLNVLQIDGILIKKDNSKNLFNINQEKIDFIIKSYKSNV